MDVIVVSSVTIDWGFVKKVIIVFITGWGISSVVEAELVLSWGLFMNMVVVTLTSSQWVWSSESLSLGAGHR